MADHSYELEYMLVYKALIDAAQHQGTIEYGQLFYIVEKKNSYSAVNWISEVLDQINHEENDCGRPMLSSVAVHRDSDYEGRPGDSYYESVETVKGLTLTTDKEKEDFWQNEICAVYDTWRLKNVGSFA